MDLAFLGIENYVCSSRILRPLKASKKQPLSDADKEYNSIISSVRVKIEHAIANLKTFFILRIRSRIRKLSILDTACNLCACLANFRLSY